MAKKFYYNTDAETTSSLTERSSLPFSLNNPGCLAVRDDGVAFLGGAAAGGSGELVIRGSTSDNYATWTDITGSLANPINGLAKI